MREVLGLTLPLWEICLRGSLAYLALVLLVRLVPKRNAGHISPNDLLTLIVVGTVASDAVVGDASSVGDIVLLVLIVLGWSWVLDELEFRVPFVRRILRDKQTALIEDGRMLRRNMRRELVTEEELMAALRVAGVADLSEVRSACMEADGEISVIKKRPGQQGG